ncbi:MAG: GNAT family N-acetyltransferase [Alphaproteobacteria bacterium]
MLEPSSLAGRAIHWPVLGVSGLLELRIAETESEIEAAQKLRYRVFYEEMSAIPTPEMRAEQRDFDRYDSFCDHLLVVDHGVRDENGEALVVATYRLLRGDIAAKHGGFYSAGEYDIAPIIGACGLSSRLLELGRSCVLKSYRSRSVTMQLLWRGILAYFERHEIALMFGCGSLPGTDPEALKLPLSYLYHFHLAPEGVRVRALPHLHVEMNRMAKGAIDEKEALRALPPLIKGYVRAGAYVGDGAVIDRQFGTTDVLIHFPVSRIDPRWREHFQRRM